MAGPLAHNPNPGATILATDGDRGVRAPFVQLCLATSEFEFRIDLWFAKTLADGKINNIAAAFPPLFC
jgi:hypothetical protein